MSSIKKLPMNWKSSLTKSSPRLITHGLLMMFVFLAQATTHAGELITSRITLAEDHYLIYVVMDVDADYKKVYQHLTDYDNLHKLSKSITESEIIYAAHPMYVIQVTTYSCIGIFCQEIVQVQNTTELSRGYIQVSVVAQESDLDYGENLWHIQPHEGGTRVTFISDMVPGFWVPPLVGTVLFKSKLLEETYAIIEGLESLANHTARE
jgi:hypothetical protein